MQVSLGNDDTTGWPADFLVFNGMSRKWDYDVEFGGNIGNNQVFLNIGEAYHAWVMVQVSALFFLFSCSPAVQHLKHRFEKPLQPSVRQCWVWLHFSNAA